MKNRLVLSVVALALLLTGTQALAGAAAAAGARGSVAAGRSLVQTHCGRCHAVGREGQSPVAAAPLFRELHQRYEVEDLAEALAEGILTGHPAMPEFRFEPTQINDIILYLKSIQTRQHARLGAPG